MNGDLRKRLSDLRSRTVEETSQKILSGKDPELEKSLLRLETISKLLAVLPRRRKLMDFSALLLAVIVLGTVAFMWISKTKNNALQFEIRSDTLEMRLRESWALSETLPLDTSLVRVERMQRIRNPWLGLDLSNESGECWMHIKADTAEIVRLDMDAGEYIRLKALDGRALSLHGSGPGISGEIQLIGEVHLVAGQTPRRRDIDTVMQLEIPETIEFLTADTGQIGSIIDAALSRPVILAGLCVDSLVFGRLQPDPNGGAVFESSVLEGKIRLTEVSTEKQLYRREPLGLYGARGRIAELGIDNDLHSVFEGCVREVNVEIKGARRNLAPSKIEYFYYNSRTTFLLSIFSSLWGLVWGIRKVLFH